MTDYIDETRNSDLFDLPSIDRQEINLLADAINSLYVNVAAVARMNRRTAHESRRVGDLARTQMFEDQALRNDQRGTAIVKLAEKFGMGIEGDE